MLRKLLIEIPNLHLISDFTLKYWIKPIILNSGILFHLHNVCIRHEAVSCMRDFSITVNSSPHLRKTFPNENICFLYPFSGHAT